MAQIIIRERDLTGTPADTTFEVAFVPGLRGTTNGGTPTGWDDSYYNRPLYIRSVSEFQSIIGTMPFQFSEENEGLKYTFTNGVLTCPDASGENAFLSGAILDPSYVYAIEILTAGIPIYYYPMSGVTTVSDVYSKMKGTGGSGSSAIVGQAIVGQAIVGQSSGGTTEGGSASIFSPLVDRGTYNIKYLTTGGYPTFEYDNNSIVSILLKVAGAVNDETDDYSDDPSVVSNGRGDCVALIDHFELDSRPLWGTGSIFATVNSSTDDNPCGLLSQSFLSYGAMFTPYAEYNLTNTYVVDNSRVNTMRLPASFAYLVCLARQNNGILPTYQAIAGVGRGSVTNIAFDSKTNSYKMCTDEILTNYIANHYNSQMQADPSEKYPISINAITQINPYGMVIYGDRTLMQKDPIDGVKATGILNIRNMVSDIKKQMYQVARRYMFSPNNDALWINFRNGVIGLLNQMQSGYGIKSYTLAKDTAKSTKSSLYVNCSIVPIYPVEKFDITIEITDDEIEVAETTES